MGRLLALIAGDGFDIAEQGAEFAVVDLDPVIEIQGDAHISVVFQLVIKGTQFTKLLGETVDLFANAFGIAGAGLGLLHPFALDATRHFDNENNESSKP